jgi:hypothetical protein
MVKRCPNCAGTHVWAEWFRLDPSPFDADDAAVLAPPDTTTLWFWCGDCLRRWEDTVPNLAPERRGRAAGVGRALMAG